MVLKHQKVVALTTHDVLFLAKLRLCLYIATGRSNNTKTILTQTIFSTSQRWTHLRFVTITLVVVVVVVVAFTPPLE